MDAVLDVEVRTEGRDDQQEVVADTGHPDADLLVALVDHGADVDVLPVAAHLGEADGEVKDLLGGVAALCPDDLGAVEEPLGMLRDPEEVELLFLLVPVAPYAFK